MRNFFKPREKTAGNTGNAETGIKSIPNEDRIAKAINNKRPRSENATTLRVVGYLKLAREEPDARQIYVTEALKIIGNVPPEDNPIDLAVKLRNEAAKDLVSSRSWKYRHALNSVKALDGIISPKIDADRAVAEVHS